MEWVFDKKNIYTGIYIWYQVPGIYLRRTKTGDRASTKKIGNNQLELTTLASNFAPTIIGDPFSSSQNGVVQDKIWLKYVRQRAGRGHNARSASDVNHQMGTTFPSTVATKIDTGQTQQDLHRVNSRRRPGKK